MTVGDTLDGAFQVLRAAWPLGLVAVLLVQLVEELVSWLVVSSAFSDVGFLQPGSSAMPTPSEIEELIGQVFAAVAITMLISLVLTLASALVVLVAVQRGEQGAQPGLGEILGTGLRRAPGLAVVTAVLLFGFLAVFGIAMFVAANIADALVAVVALASLPFALALYGAYAMLPAAVLLEGRGAWAALGRSLSIVRRRFGRVLGITLLLFLLLIAISIGVGLLTVPFSALGDGVQLGVSILVGAVLGIIGVAVTAGVGAMLVLDTSARLEGADLTDRAQGFGPEPWNR